MPAEELSDQPPSPSDIKPCRNDSQPNTPTLPQHDQQHNTITNHPTTPPHQQNDVVSPPDLVKDEQVEEEDEDEDEEEDEEPQEFALIDLQTIRKEVQCPICLGIIKKTRTVMECLHRFCRECIDKSMRMGNNECPACRTHCASRRSLRDDPRYDALIAALYPDVKKFEEEELAFCEEDETRNKQIQDSIAQVVRKQSEVLGKRRTANKDTARNYQNVHSRRRRKRRRNASPENQDSDDNNDANDNDKHFDADEHHAEIKVRKGKSRASIGSSPSQSENNLEESKEARGSSRGLTCSQETLAWGKGGVRSNTRNGNVNSGMSRNACRIRIGKFVEFLRNIEDNDEEYLSLQTSVQPENIQVPGIQDSNGSCVCPSTPHHSSGNKKHSQVADPLQDRLHILEREETLSGVVTSCVPNREQLILARQQKEAM